MTILVCLRTYRCGFIFVFLLQFLACNLSRNVEHTKKYTIPIGDNAKQLSPYFFEFTGDPYLIFQEKNEDSVYVKTLSLQLTSKISILDAALNSERFSNWADFPRAITFQNSVILNHVLQKVPGSVYAYHIQLKTSDYKTALLHSDVTPTEHGFVSYSHFGRDIFATWLDGRDTGGSEHLDHSHASSSGAMHLRGRFVDSSLVMSEEILLDERVCDCCQTDVVLNSQNELVVFYRDRSEGELRDIGRIIVGKDGVLSKKLVHSDNWKIGGCPVNGPSAEAVDSTILVAWFSAAEEKNRVKFAFSTNDGWDFGAPTVLDENGIGRCNVISHEDYFLLSWMRRNEKDEAEIMLSTVKDGLEHKRSVLANTSDSRSVGFPKITVLNTELVLTYVSDSTDQIVLKHFNLDDIL